MIDTPIEICIDLKSIKEISAENSLQPEDLEDAEDREDPSDANKTETDLID